MSSPTPESFRASREAAQARLRATSHLGIDRFLTLDTGAYRDRTADGGLDGNTKELLGLVASMVLRCDDCINYHTEQCVKAGYTVAQITDAMHVALIVGGSIVMPHMRRALLMLDQFAAEHSGPGTSS